jgi:hypothetical protein
MLHPNLQRLIDLTAPMSYVTPRIELSGITDGAQGIGTITIQDRGFVCTQARVTGWYLDAGNAKRILMSDSVVDLTRILLKSTSSGQRDLMSAPIDIWAFNDAYSGETFNGWFLRTKAELTATIYNEIITASNYAMPVYFDVVLSGFHALVDEFPKLTR